MSDSERILFLINREANPQKVVDFAIQARSQYRRIRLAMKRKNNTAYRKPYIDSYLFHKRFLFVNCESSE